MNAAIIAAVTAANIAQRNATNAASMAAANSRRTANTSHCPAAYDYEYWDDPDEDVIDDDDYQSGLGWPDIILILAICFMCGVILWVMAT